MDMGNRIKSGIAELYQDLDTIADIRRKRMERRTYSKNGS
jgi:hypothetical protein